MALDARASAERILEPGSRPSGPQSMTAVAGGPTVQHRIHGLRGEGTYKRKGMTMTFHPIPSPPVLLLAAALLLGPAAGASADWPEIFDTWTGYDTGLHPDAFFPYEGQAVDLNNDGAADVIASNWWATPKVSVVLNHGDGSMALPQTYPIQHGSYGITAADFDNDGFADIAASNTGTNYDGNTVSLLRNNGDGTFASQQIFLTGSGSFVGPVGLAAADFDGDDWIDLAVANYGYLGNGNEVAILFNDGTGGFTSPVHVAVGPSPYRLAAGDLDGDDTPDIAVARDEKKVAILINNGDGSFAPYTEYTMGSQAAGDFYPTVELADRENDEDLDVFYVSTRTQINSDTGAVAILDNNGDGTFAGPANVPLVA
ncbi:MAG: hypothetical protein GF355_04745, partial [Candidatus Eisenbacteria bacterium]|nr:hypothetical protein [Candidatus Eisenbacteria bacterium]